MTGPRLSRGRYFLALWPPDPVRDALARMASEWLRGVRRDFRPVRPERYHLTVCFIGDLDETGAQALEACLPGLLEAQARPFRLQLDRVGHFGRNAGWLGCSEPPPELLGLHQGLSRVLQQGRVLLAAPQAFVPHVTVARGMHGSWPEFPAGAVQASWEVEDWVLVRSLPAQGHAYRIVARRPLLKP